jgi:hypothetical protein
MLGNLTFMELSAAKQLSYFWLKPFNFSPNGHAALSRSKYKANGFASGKLNV